MRTRLLVLAILTITVHAKEPAFIQQESKAIWRDEEAQTLWTDVLVERLDREQAKIACMRYTDGLGHTFQLPDRSDFETMEKHGGRSFLPNMKDHFFWTRTPHPISPNVRLVYNGNFGTLFWVMYNNIGYESVRCISHER